MQGRRIAFRQARQVEDHVLVPDSCRSATIQVELKKNIRSPKECMGSPQEIPT